MELVNVGLETKAIEHRGQFPTVGELLKYIKDNEIPLDAEIVIEHVEDIYLLKYHWSQYKINSNTEGETTLLPVHNGFGWVEDKKYFVIWMHC